MLDVITAWHVMIFIHSFRRNLSFFYHLQLHAFLFYKNKLYKNIEDEMGQKVKNILRICSS